MANPRLEFTFKLTQTVRLREFAKGRCRSMVMMTDAGTDADHPHLAKCRVFEALTSELGQTQIDKLKAMIAYALDDPKGLGAIPGKAHICHQATLTGVAVKFFGIDVGNFRFYGFEHGGRLIVMTLFARKRSKKTHAADIEQMERRCTEYLVALAAGVQIVFEA